MSQRPIDKGRLAEQICHQYINGYADLPPPVMGDILKTVFSALGEAPSSAMADILAETKKPALDLPTALYNLSAIQEIVEEELGKS